MTKFRVELFDVSGTACVDRHIILTVYRFSITRTSATESVFLTRMLYKGMYQILTINLFIPTFTLYSLHNPLLFVAAVCPPYYEHLAVSVE